MPVIADCSVIEYSSGKSYLANSYRACGSRGSMSRRELVDIADCSVIKDLSGKSFMASSYRARGSRGSMPRSKLVAVADYSDIEDSSGIGQAWSIGKSR